MMNMSIDEELSWRMLELKIRTIDNKFKFVALWTAIIISLFSCKIILEFSYFGT